MIAIESVSQKAQLSPAWATSVASMSRGEGMIPAAIGWEQ